MADNSILTPGLLTPEKAPAIADDVSRCLKVDNYLSEYETEEQKSVVRENLSVPSKDSVYTKQDTDIQVSLKIRDAIQEYLNMEDPHGILPTVELMIEGIVKQDGSTPFKSPQKGVEPVTDDHLTTKKFVTRLIKEHINNEDPHDILPEVKVMLLNYVKSLDVYLKSQVYTKAEADKLNNLYVKKDGTISFTKALIGVDPQIDSHLATKRYVDKTLYQHLVDIDPHGFLTILNQRLAQYIKKKDVYDKTQTYSRTQIDNLVIKLVNDAIEQSMQDYVDSINDKFEYIRKQKYIKLDGSIPFTAPQIGVPATSENELATLGQVTQSLEKNLLVWITSGPVLSTVGHVEDNFNVPDKMTFQEIMDAIFYGREISIDVSDSVNIGTSTEITVCVHGSLGMIDHVDLMCKGEIINTFNASDFENGCITVSSPLIIEDADITLKVYYTNGDIDEETKTIKCDAPSFVGLLPKWKPANTITMEYLEELTKDSNNKFFESSENSITIRYQFEDSELRRPFIVVPKDHAELDTMVTNSLSFGKNAFDVVTIPLDVKGIERDIMYKIYVYKQGLSSLNLEITFNFVH